MTPTPGLDERIGSMSPEEKTIEREQRWLQDYGKPPVPTVEPTSTPIPEVLENYAEASVTGRRPFPSTVARLEVPVAQNAEGRRPTWQERIENIDVGQSRPDPRRGLPAQPGARLARYPRVRGLLVVLLPGGILKQTGASVLGEATGRYPTAARISSLTGKNGRVQARGLLRGVPPDLVLRSRNVAVGAVKGDAAPLMRTVHVRSSSRRSTISPRVGTS